MANETKNVLAGTPLVSGGILVGALTDAAPTDAATALAAGFKATGYIGEDGLTETVDRSTDKIRAWGGDTVKVVQSDFSVTYQFTFLETLNTDVLKAVYGDDNVTVTAATATAGTLRTVLINGDKLPQKSYVFEVKDDDARIRIYVPKGQVIEVGDVTYNDTDVIGYQVTIEAFKDATLNANSIKFIDDGVFSA
jgi:hypothetical protein